jgi:ribosomal protein S18 acetylase RimI-like enzyme
MPISYRLAPFDSKALPAARDLAELHATLLPTSPISLLGRPFMERFYYAILPREGLIFGALAYVNHQPAGFVVATHDPARFMRSALRRWWPSLVWVVGTSVLLAPKSISAVREALRVMMSRCPARDGEPQGEILSLGVLSTFREAHFVRQSGLRLSNDLLNNAVARLQAKGIRAIHATVSAENLPAQFFYRGLGWTVNRTNASGWRHPTVEFVWRT